MTRESARDTRDDEPAAVVPSFSSANDASAVESGPPVRRSAERDLSRRSVNAKAEGGSPAADPVAQGFSPVDRHPAVDPRDIDSLPGREPRDRSLEPDQRHSSV